MGKMLIANIKGPPGDSIEDLIDHNNGTFSAKLTNGEIIGPVVIPRGPAGQDAPDTEVSWDGTYLIVNGFRSPDLRGPVGFTGDKGDTGDQGQIGPKGDTGLQGPKGDTGLTGPKGDTGQIGPKGDTGTTGLQGPKGDKGDVGLQGPKGDKGDVGLQGPKGDKGDIGLTGPKGDTGLQGPKGDKGDTGSTGPAGSVPTTSSYLISGPGRPDIPSTTSGLITGSERVGCKYLSTNGANVGAWEWLKTISGWVVSYGDTGDVELTNEFKRISDLNNIEYSQSAGFAPPSVRRTTHSIAFNVGVNLTQKGEISLASIDYKTAFGHGKIFTKAIASNWQIPASVTGSVSVIHWAGSTYVRFWGQGGQKLVGTYTCTDPWPTTIVI